MSAQGRGAERIEDDAYETPSWCVDRLLESPLVADIAVLKNWMEPCAGEGAIIRAVNALVPRVSWWAVELREECREPLGQLVSTPIICDYVRYAESVREVANLDVIISNPPYSVAQQVIEASLPLARWVIMLLRVNFQASDERHSFMRQYPPDVLVLPNRPRFRTGINPKNGKVWSSDATEYAWFCWPPGSKDRPYGRNLVLNLTPGEERAREFAERSARHARLRAERAAPTRAAMGD